jgi:hypothetical protein
VSAATILAAYGLWLAIVAPVNAELAAAGRIAPEAVPSVWALYRSRLEIGHAVGLALHLAGLIALLASVAVDRRGAG